MSGEAAAFDEKLEVPTSDFAEGGTTLASNASPNSGTLLVYVSVRLTYKVPTGQLRQSDNFC